MIDVSERRHELLTRIVNAGSQGYQIQQGELCDVLSLGLHDLIVLTNSKTPPQRAVATARGRAFSRRTAA